MAYLLSPVQASLFLVLVWCAWLRGIGSGRASLWEVLVWPYGSLLLVGLGVDLVQGSGAAQSYASPRWPLDH